MHICDKCKKYNQCYPMKGEAHRAKVVEKGCRDYRELTIKEMFFNDKGGKSRGKNE